MLCIYKKYMKFLIKRSLVSLLLLATLSVLGYFFLYKTKIAPAKTGTNNTAKNKNDYAAFALRLKAKTTQIKKFASVHNYNITHCFMVDMRMASGEKRCFIYNLAKDSIELSGLVAQGCGREGVQAGIKFSNTVNSLCTSLGRYRVGNAYTGKFGLAFKLYGLDITNSNAESRVVVLHAMGCIPNYEIVPQPICESWGCPAVSPIFLQKIKRYLDNTQKPMLLYIYY